MKIDGLNATISRLDQISQGLGAGTNRMLLQLAAKQALNIKEGTRAGRDINGQAFKRLALRVGTPLDNTGKMLAAVKPVKLADGIAGVVLGSGPENLKGVAHQFGTGIYNEKGNTGPIRPTGGGAGHTYVTGSGRRRKWHVSSGGILGPIKAGTGRGRLFFRSVKGTPVRKWFGFRPGDKEKLIAEAEKLLDAIVKKRTA